MSMMEMLANIALLNNDFLAIISLLGPLVLLLEVGFGTRARRRPRRLAGKMGKWSVGGLLLGIAGQVAIAESLSYNSYGVPGSRRRRGTSGLRPTAIGTSRSDRPDGGGFIQDALRGGELDPVLLADADRDASPG